MIEAVHEQFLASVPTTPSVVVNLGSRSARDLTVLAGRGHRVCTVER